MICHDQYPTLALQETKGHVHRQDQIDSTSRGRGRGHGGRGRGRGRGRGARDDTEEIQAFRKKRKHAGKEKELTKEEWDAMAVEEYNKIWNEEMDDDGSNWTYDWSKPPQAFDRYAHLDGTHSMHKLKDADGDDGAKPSKKEKKGKGKDDDNHEGEPTKKEKKKGKKQVEDKEDEPAARKKASNKSKKANKPKVEEDDDEVVKACRVPKQEREQVAQITAYLRSINYLGETVGKAKDLTGASKTVLRENTPNSEEGRLSVYWKMPSTGVFLRAEKREFCNIPLKDPDLPYHLCLGATLKAASMLASWMTLVLKTCEFGFPLCYDRQILM